jgi:peptidoglycan/xylan/chitin deacetylase (PgdA/CDA1 family)
MIPLAPIINLISPANHRACLSVLIFHRVLPSVDPLFPGEPTEQWFDQMLGWLKKWFNVLPLDEALERTRLSALPSRAAAITFDDGYADNYEVALPILKKHGLSATFFVATGHLNGGRMWNDTVVEAIRSSRIDKLDLSGSQAFASAPSNIFPIGSLAEKRAAIESVLGKIKYLQTTEREAVINLIADQIATKLPNNLMMTSEQVIEMRRSGMLIGAHTVNHPILANLQAVQVRTEISESKKFLEVLLQENVRLFAYPNGKPNLDYQARDALIIKELGFDAALTTAWGVVDRESDLMQLPRFTPWDRTELRFGTRLIKNILQNKQLKCNQKAD